MLGTNDQQSGILDYNWIQHLIPKDSVYFVLNQAEDTMLKDEDFAHLYSETLGRYSVNPVTMAKAILLMDYEGISDREAESRTRFDNRWKFALNRPLDSDGIDHTTICNFRLLCRTNDLEQLIFDRIMEYAKDQGILDDASVQAIDSTLLRGAAAMKGTYDLIHEAIVRVLGFTKRRPRLRRRLLKELRQSYENKKKPTINWDDETAQNLLLNDLVTDALRIMDAAAEIEDPVESDFAEALRVLGQVTAQDVEQADSGRMVIKRGTTSDRILSLVDPEMRHSRKSRSNKVNGYKVSMMVDLDSELITGIHTHTATEADSAAVNELLHQQQEQGIKVKTLLGDSAYGSGKQRKQMNEKEIALLAKTPPTGARKGQMTKEQFHIYTDTDIVRCPAGKKTNEYTTAKTEDGDRVKVFRFDAAKCNRCMLKSKCTESEKGRTIRVGPYEAELQSGRKQQKTSEFKEQYKERSVVERKFAHLKRPNQGKSRYMGLEKTKAHMLLTAAATNLRTIGGRLCARITSNKQNSTQESLV